MNIKTSTLYVITAFVTSLNISAEPRPDVYPVVNPPNHPPLSVEVVKPVPTEAEYFMYTTECKIPPGEFQTTCIFPQIKFPGDTNAMLIEKMHTSISTQAGNITTLSDTTTDIENLTAIVGLETQYRRDRGHLLKELSTKRSGNRRVGSVSSDPGMRSGSDEPNPPKITCLINAPLDTIASCLVTIIGKYMIVEVPIDK